MTVLVFLWGLEYIAAKAALHTIEPLSLVCIKYTIGGFLLLITKAIVDRTFPLKLRDLPILIICSLFGEVVYFGAEYTAMEYLPVSVITIILAFVPCVSIAIEAIFYKTRPTGIMILGVFTSVLGVSMVIGADFSEIFQGKYIGYVLAFAAVICWNIYNFMTKGLSERYKPLDLTLLQQLCSILIVLPYTLTHFPDVEMLDTQVMTGVIYLGVVSAYIGFLIYVKGIDVLGPTPCALFSNFLPVTSTFFGWVILQEHISGVQLLGGVVVIVSGALVIWQKGKVDRE